MSSNTTPTPTAAIDPDSDDVRSAPLPADPASRAVKLEPFNKSEALSLGVELELQLVNTHDYDLAPYAEDMLRLGRPAHCPDNKLGRINIGLGQPFSSRFR